MNEENAKKLLFEVADIVEDIGLRFSLYAGTCLGAVREGKFIDTDRDLDLGCLNEDFVPLADRFQARFEECDFKTELIDHRHEQPWNGLPYGIKIYKYGERTDFFSFFRLNGWRIVPSHIESHCHAHKAEHIEDLVSMKFYGRQFNVPRDSDGFLTNMYCDWRTPFSRHANPKSAWPNPVCLKQCISCKFSDGCPPKGDKSKL